MTWPVRHQDDEMTEAVADAVKSTGWFLGVVVLRALGAFVAVVNGVAMLMFWVWDQSMEASGRKNASGRGASYSLLFIDESCWVPFNMNVRHLTMSDKEDVCEKPRNRFTAVLSGCIMEQTLDLETGLLESEWRAPWSFGYAPADRPTRMELSSIETNPECWILSIDLSGPKEWGYYKGNDRDKWVSSETVDGGDSSDHDSDSEDTVVDEQDEPPASSPEKPVASSIWFLGGKSSAPVKQD